MLTVQQVAPFYRLEHPLCWQRRRLASNEPWLQTSIDQRERPYAKCKKRFRCPPQRRVAQPGRGTRHGCATSESPPDARRPSCRPTNSARTVSPPAQTALPQCTPPGFPRPRSTAAGSYQTPGNSSSLCVDPAPLPSAHAAPIFPRRLPAQTSCRSHLQRLVCAGSRAEARVHGRRPGRSAGEACPP